MPNKSKNSTPESALQHRVPSSGRSVVSSSGRSMPPTIRSMQGRLSSTGQGSSPQVRTSTPRNIEPQGTPQRTASVAVSRATSAVARNDDDDDDDDDEEDSGDDDDEDDEDESSDGDDDGDDDDDDDNGDDDDDDDVRTKLLKVFAMVEPNGLVMSEIDNDRIIGAQSNSKASAKFRDLLDVISREATRNPAFCLALLGEMAAPSSEWSQIMSRQLRTRLDVIKLRFEQSLSHAMNVHVTATRLTAFINAIQSMVKTTNWRTMQLVVRLEYFGLLLDALQFVVAHDRDYRRPGSGGSSPFVGDPVQNHNLYQRMVSTSQCSHAVILLAGMLGRMQGSLDQRQTDNIRAMQDAVARKTPRRSTPAADGSPGLDQQFHLRLRCLIPVPAPRGSQGSR